jgi:cytochrome c oxidase subunit I+III
VRGLSTRAPEVLITTLQDARADHRLSFPTPSIWPLISAIAVTVLFVASIFTPWAVVWGSIPVAIALTCWFWPTRKETAEHLALERKP